MDLKTGRKIVANNPCVQYRDLKGGGEKTKGQREGERDTERGKDAEMERQTERQRLRHE